jgi:hypothetical protein
MQSNHFGNTILGALNHGQAIVVGGTHRTLRVLVANLARRLALRLGALPRANWRALDTAKPALAMCPSYSALRRQRDQRWMPGVVATRGTVGVR